MDIYTQRTTLYSTKADQLNKKYNLISVFRFLSLVLFFVAGYFYYTSTAVMYLILLVVSLIAFGYLVKLHDKINYLKAVNTKLVEINSNELAFLNHQKIPFENGVEFTDFEHLYCYDLDLFGDHSLFQNLNRTATFTGKSTLARQLLTLLPNTAIICNQVAVSELKLKFDWRQHFFAIAKVTKDSKTTFQTLIKWSRGEAKLIAKGFVLFSFVSPVVLMCCCIAFIYTKQQFYLTYVVLLFLLNLYIASRFYKHIKAEINDAENIDQIIKQYSLLVQKIESEVFISEKLIGLQSKLWFNNRAASQHLKKLSQLFSQMDIFFNVLATLIFNGLFLFHLHILRYLMLWKRAHAKQLESWLDVIGEFEMLSSLANFAYNNPSFATPVLNSNFEVSFKSCSHPLLKAGGRIGNDIVFQPQSFVILTGSNMSGKSTFLRALGINMVLAGIGSVVCATEAQVHPMPILVSMRLSDSLSDNESYFYAEIKRLKNIMDQLATTRSFILLDEILRGTNSDDKRNGTVEVVKKMIEKQALGVIATHDIEVCLTTNQYPMQLKNNCFEVEIVNNDLHFDFKLRDGICKNRSASFLMRKMGVI